MTDFILFWLMKPLAEVIIITLIVCALLIIQALGLISQSRCKHTGRVRETSSCDAICADCGKNLGFIGAWRKSGQDVRTEE